MTTPAKIEANRLNGQLSTGPRTPEGKAAVARNATKHGIFAAVPVLPGEDPEVWEGHRAGVVASLGPVGVLEVNLAERAALLLWRLQRLARYEAETTATAMQNADLPTLPAPDDAFTRPNPLAPQKTRDDQLRDVRRELDAARQGLAEIAPACDFFHTRADVSPEQAVPFSVVETVLETACSHAETSETVRGNPPAFGSKPFLRKLGQAGADAKGTSWTLDLIHRGLALYAGYTREGAARFLSGVALDLEEQVETLGRQVARLERSAAALVWLLDGSAAQNRTARMMPSDGRDERIAKYERHLHSLLTSTLHELERLQARREGQPVPPPAVADVNVTVDTGPA